MIVIFGGSGYAAVVISMVEQQGIHKICGIIDGGKPKGTDVLGYPVLGDDDDLPHIMQTHDITGGIIALGDNALRKKVNDKIINRMPDFNFVGCIHPSAVIGKGCVISPSCQVLAGVIIDPCSTLGAHSIVNIGAAVGHDNVMEDFTSIAPNAATGGFVRLGRLSAIGIGANVLEHTTIGENCIIGGGSMVIRDVADNSVCAGVPAKVIREQAAIK